jgi:nucleotide-binding universal stress UspA family protein
MERILVGIDFSAESEEAARTALVYARAFDAAVTLLHVHELPTMMTSIVPGGDPLTDTRALRTAAEERLARFRERLQTSDPRALEGGVPIETVVVGGLPSDEIVRQARAGHYDLLVIGTLGLSGLRRLLIGSVTESVIRHAPCPVVTVHAPSVAHAPASPR